MLLFPHLEDLLDTELNKKECEFIQVCTLSNLDRHIFDLEWLGIGRKPKDRLSILKAFVAKAVFNLDSNRSLITYLNSIRRFAVYVAGNIKRAFLMKVSSLAFSV